MVTITLKGRITDDGRLEVELPAGLPPGDVDVVLQMIDDMNENDNLFVFEGKPLGELETGGWEDLDIEDSTKWVDEQRRKEQERRGKWMY
ncbi:MAG: hypothetical protein D6737_05435 [Chloroflexi bacterium]|nr:MAG: hypothetical protein D6737_05435 [Chloroflexota bacterium]